MFKRIISFGLCLVMLAVLFAGCGKKQEQTTTTNPEDLPQTINLIGITERTTTQEAIDFVEDALNKLSKTRYKTKIELTLVTADEYMKEVEKRVAEANLASVKLEAIKKYNALAVKEAGRAQKLLSESNTKKNKWTSQVTSVVASTMSTGEIYSAEQTTVYEDGKIEVVYPAAQSPIDILMIDGKEMYEELEAKGYLLSVKKQLEEKFTKFRQYIYPTFFDQLDAMTGDIKAIPNNNLLAEYTYVIIDKTIADQYNDGNGFNIDNVDNYADLEEFLAYVKDNHTEYAPLATEPEALGIYQFMEGELAIGTYYDPIYGYDPAEGTDFRVQNLLSIPQYQDHVALMEKYNANQYIDTAKEKFAVNVIKGNAYVEKEYGDDYYVKVIQNPFVEPDKIFDGMFAVSAFTSNEVKALEIIEMFTTDPEAKNIFQYGIAYDGENETKANYKLVEVEGESGKFIIERMNNNYMMDNRLTGNVYMGYPEPAEDGKPAMPFDAWDYYKITNLDSGIAPFLNLYITESGLDDILSSVLARAALTAALDEIDIDYDKYLVAMAGSSQDKTTYSDALRKANAVFFANELAKANARNDAFKVITQTAGTSLAVTEFVKFIQSGEGQTIIGNVGYVAVDPYAMPYDKVDTLTTGTINILSNTGSSTRQFFDSVMNTLIEEFNKIYPEVTFTTPTYDPAKGYSDAMNDVNNPNKIGFTYAAQVPGKTETQIATSYFSVLLDQKDANFMQVWYENKLVDKVKNEQYANIVSATDLQQLIENKIASLGGARPNQGQANTERVTFAAARKNAQGYYTNIAYLRVMANEILFSDDAAKAAEFSAMSDKDFMTAIFNYVRQNYETENELTPEEYEKRVQDFMVSVLEYSSKENSNEKYYVSWEAFITAEEGSGLYGTAAKAITEQYKDQLRKKNYYYGLLSLDKQMDLVYEIMCEEYLKSNGLSEDDLKAIVMNRYLSEVKSNAADFTEYAKNKKSDEYTNIVSKLRKKYKTLLIEEFSATAYKNGEKGISNDQVVTTLYNHFLEEELGIYNKMADMAGVDVNEFLESGEHYANFAMYISTLKTKYVYTLLTEYNQAEIDAWELTEAKEKIFKILEEKGFYTNELARYIGMDLSAYMLAESDAKAYQTYLNKLAEQLAEDIAAKGYDKDALLKGDGTELEAVAYEIVAEKYFGDKSSVTEELRKVSADYMQKIKDGYSSEEMKADAEAFAESSDPQIIFFNAVVNELQAMWEAKKAETTN
ncbi:MAG: hypothetical protein IJA86_06510 [Clostridia bacterium]|nr:hypothetical protein [Clostridia bacterium]